MLSILLAVAGYLAASAGTKVVAAVKNVVVVAGQEAALVGMHEIEARQASQACMCSRKRNSRKLRNKTRTLRRNRTSKSDLDAQAVGKDVKMLAPPETGIEPPEHSVECRNMGPDACSCSSETASFGSGILEIGERVIGSLFSEATSGCWDGRQTQGALSTA